MTQPKNDEPNPYDAPSGPPLATPGEHLAARLSIIAAFTCFTINCVGGRVLFKMPGHAPVWDTVVGSMSSGCVLVGILLGMVGFVGGIRKKKPDTVTMAIIGLTLNVGIAAVAVWMLSILRRDVAP